jgi:hypothetical protein
VIFETQPVPAVANLPRKAAVPGTARYIVRVFDVGEAVPPIYDYAQRVDEWLATIEQDGALRADPPSNLRGALTTALVPRSLIDGLPRDSLLAGEWEFVPGGRR